MIQLDKFIIHVMQNAPQIMWFLGAGTSRSAGMPSAEDIIWDLKRRYYCLHEGKEVDHYDLNNEAIKHKIQAYLDAQQRFPVLWAKDEYEFYFDKFFQGNLEQQQRYIEEQLAPEKLSLNSGHKILAALLAMGKTKIVFTTNFDAVIEKAYAEINGGMLQTYHLEGSYAALDALNNESYPFYIKLHGDFRYRSIKNLPSQLKSNDEQLRKAFVSACARYGLIVSGYSGRDENVMQCFRDAICQENAFPKGFFWTTSSATRLHESVKDLITDAKTKGITAEIVEVDNFDELMNKLWKQIPAKPEEYQKKIRRNILTSYNTATLEPGNEFPVIRTNAFPILEFPQDCLQIHCPQIATYEDLIERMKSTKADVIVTKKGKGVLYLGSQAEKGKFFIGLKFEESMYALTDDIKNLGRESLVSDFLTRAVGYALVRTRPLQFRKRGSEFYVIVDSKNPKDAFFLPLLKATSAKTFAGQISGDIAGTPAKWREAVQFNLEFKNNQLWLLIIPTIHIDYNITNEKWEASKSDPKLKAEIDAIKQAAKGFSDKRKRYRFNAQTSSLLDAWSQMLIGEKKHTVELKSFNEACEHNAKFTASSTTAFSLRKGQR